MPKPAHRPLRGRDRELATLTRGLADPAVRLMVASGPSGSGKSALVAAARRSLTASRTLVGYAHFSPATPSGASPLLLALDQAVQAALEQLFDPDAALDTLAAQLGPAARAFATLPGGALAQLAARAAPDAQPLGGEAAAQRIGQAVVELAAWLAPLCESLLLVLEDWGRGGPPLAALVDRLLGETGHVRVLATERPSEAAQLGFAGRTLRIELGSLAGGDRRDLLADLLDGDSAAADAVNTFLPEGPSLPLELVQQVAALRDCGALKASSQGMIFLPAVAAAALGEALAGVLMRRIAAAGGEALRLAHMLAAFEGEAQLADLAAALGLAGERLGEPVAALARLGAVEVAGETVRFAHDSIHMEVAAAGGAEAARLAAVVAETLRTRGAPAAGVGRGARMLQARLKAGLDEAEARAWRDLFAEGAALARAGGQQSEAGAWSDAALRLARRMGGDVPPAILRQAVFAAIERSDHATGRALADEMLAAAQGPQAEAEADELRILVRRAAGDVRAALAAAREALARRGLRLPAQRSRLTLLTAAARVLLTDVASARRKAGGEELAVFTPLIRALSATGSLLYERDPMLAVLFAVNALPARLAVGTAAGAGTYSVLCSAFGAFRKAQTWAQACDALQGPEQPSRAMAMQYATNFGFAMTTPRQLSKGRIAEMERLAYAEGDLAVAAYANRRRVLDRLFSDSPLPEIGRDLRQGLEIARRLQDQPTLTSVAAMNQVVACLSSDLATPWRLEGEHFSARAFEASDLGQATHLARHIHTFTALLAAAFGAYEAGAALYRETKGFFRPPAFQLLPQTWAFATALALYRTGGRPKAWRLWVLRHHARHNPTDHAHRVLLLEAEAARLRGAREKALLSYEAALAAAARSGCALEHGIVASAAAEGAALLGAGQAAARYASERDEVWRAFGAHAVLRQVAPTRAPRASAVEPEALRRLEDEAAVRELELAASRDVAERASRAKSRLLAEVAHELRTPLQGAAGLLEGGDPPRPEELETLRGALRHLSAVVSDLADVGALDAGGIALAPHRFQPDETARQVAQMHAAMAGERRVVVDAQASPAVLADEGRVRQVLSNLVANALRHGDGQVSIALTATPGTTADGRSRPIALRYEIADEGPGIAPDLLPTLFEPFRRGSGPEVEGLGLGLPIARRLARALGGELVALPSETGARFVFTLTAPAAERASDQPASGPRVLLAEDVTLSRRVMARLLAEEGCRVVEAADGAEALALWRERPFDLVITDQRMPGLNGSELAAQLVAEGCSHPIVIACGADEAALREAIRELPRVSVMAKPLGRPQVRACLTGLEARQRAPDTPSTARLAELREALGGAAPEILERLRPELVALADEVRQAAAADSAATAQAAHRLAGLANHFGLEAVATAARTIEANAAEGRACKAALRQLEAGIGAIDWALFTESA